jgi:hypothetical protein
MVARVIAVASVLLSLTAGITAPVAAQGLDKYGGVRDIKVPGGATGYFRTAKVGNRWILATPEGHAFWMLAVYGIDITDGGGSYVETLKKKYGSPQYIPWETFAKQAVIRLKSWGFNALGEYTTPYALPVPSFGRKSGNSEQLPFVGIMKPAYRAKIDYYVKNVQFGVDTAVTHGLWRVEGFPDVFDPAFAAAVSAQLTNKAMATSPWVIGVTSDDRDYLFGFGPQREFNGWHNHLGWQAAATRPTQTENPHIWKGATKGIKYKDTTVYTKHAFRDFLKERYGSLDVLNKAWGSTYTTWESDGEWPNGKGVLDESGRGRWLGKDFYALKDSHPTVKKDLDDFVGVLADQYFGTVAKVYRAVRPNHMLFSPATIPFGAHAKVLEAAGRHCDALQVGGSWESDAIFDRAYMIAKKPFYVWTTYMAQKDSPLAKHPAWNHVERPTQTVRGEAYAANLERLFNFKASDGTHPFIGIDWWAWTDKVTGGEAQNFGLVSNKDNAYDGQEAVQAVGKDKWGFATGGEAGNYGDFLSHVKKANEQMQSRVREALSGSAKK